MTNRIPPIEPPTPEACVRARAAIELARPVDAEAPHIKPALAHVESCPACQQAVRLQQEFDRRVEEHIGDVSLPAGLKERLLAAVAAVEPTVAASNAGSQIAIRAVRPGRQVAARRRRLVSMAAVAACAVVVCGGWLYWRLQSPRVDLKSLTLQAIELAPAAPGSEPATAGLLLPATMRTDLIAAPPHLLTADDAGVYLFDIPLRGRRPVEGRLLVVPARRVQSRPAAAAFFAGEAVYLNGYCTTAWQEGEFVYVCCVKAGEDILRGLLPSPRTTT